MLDYKSYNDKRIKEEHFIMLRPLVQCEIDRGVWVDVKEGDVLEEGGMIGSTCFKVHKFFYVGKQEFEDYYELRG